MNSLRLVTALTLVLTVATHAQLAITPPTTKLLILPLRVGAAADSATSVALMDAVREREIRRIMRESKLEFSHDQVARRYMDRYEAMLSRPLVNHKGATERANSGATWDWHGEGLS